MLLYPEHLERLCISCDRGLKRSIIRTYIFYKRARALLNKAVLFNSGKSTRHATEFYATVNHFSIFHRVHRFWQHIQVSLVYVVSHVLVESLLRHMCTQSQFVLLVVVNKYIDVPRHTANELNYAALNRLLTPWASAQRTEHALSSQC